MVLIFVKPKKGVLIRRPDTGKILSEAGEYVPRNLFWMRRLADKDIEQINLDDSGKSDIIKDKVKKKTKVKNGG